MPILTFHDIMNQHPIYVESTSVVAIQASLGNAELLLCGGHKITVKENPETVIQALKTL